MTIEWEKIVTNAVSALVVSVFMGAAVITWKGATSVDDKVQNTREDMTHLIDSLSDKLGGYEVQLTSLSNQLSIVINNQSNIVVTSSRPIKRTIPEVDIPNQAIQQKAYSQDIMKELKRAK